MGKIKKWYRSIPIWLALFLFVITALLIASFISSKITVTVNELCARIQAKYITYTSDFTQDGNDVIYSNNDVNEFVEYNFNYDTYSEGDRQLYQTYRLILRYTPPVLYSVSILAAVLLFYFTKLKKPLKELTMASDRIAESELDFSLHYIGNDEMAKLCDAFEKMRYALLEDNRRMLYMIDQRKQLNDAYTHDLRTPISVLKGYTEMLTKYLPDGEISQEEAIETLWTMSTHISRLEQFVESMNTVQKLEDLMIQKERVTTGELAEHLKEIAEILCVTGNLKCEFSTEIDSETLFLDVGAVIQVFENIMSNATRYAATKVIVKCNCRDEFLWLSVADDGKGFAEKELLKATQPYYTGDDQKRGCHFGLGLHICQTLCEKHGGKIQLSSSSYGGAIVTAYFSVS